jgi:hypothetical protein
VTRRDKAGRPTAAAERWCGLLPAHLCVLARAPVATLQQVLDAEVI